MKQSEIHPSGKHSLLRQQFQQALRAMGQVVLSEDLAIADTVLSTEKHFTVEEIHDSVAKRFPEASMAHVRRTLGLLVDLGILRKMEVSGRPVFEHMHFDEHHDHLICLKCGKIVEFTDDQIEERQLKAAVEHGFHPLVHRLEIRGVCDSCMGARSSVRTLESVKPGEKVFLRDLLGGTGFISRLSEMGLTRGVEVNVVSNNSQIVLEVRGTRMGIGHGMARKILVSDNPTKEKG